MSIHKKGDVYYVVYRHQGRQIWKRAGKLKREAVALEAEITAKRARGEHRELKKATFAQFVEIWRRDAAPRLAASTRDEYECYLRRHLLPYFGHLDMRQLNAHDIECYINLKLDGGLSAKSVRNHLATLGSLLTRAVRWDYISSNPLRNVDRPKRTKSKASFLAASDVRLLLAHSEEPWHTLLLTAVMTGMRQGELLGLQWSCVDFDAHVLRVEHSLYKGELKDPKTESSNRVIPMSDQVEAALLDHKLNAPASPMDLVFAKADGSPLSKKSCGLALKSALERAGLPPIRFHDLRHTFSSVLIAMGESPKVVQELLGHSTSAITLDIYTHAFSEAKQSAITRLDNMIKG